MVQRLSKSIEQNQSWQANILHAIRDVTLAGGRNETERTSETFARFIVQNFTSALLDHLRYQEMDDRYEDIPTAHAKTFHWIFRQPETDDSSSSFVDWVRSPSDSIYWVTGKPGSGKSTLMKFITDAPDTREHLQGWTGSRDLLILSFYFWNSGTEKQMDQEGLFRRLLHQALSKHPGLASTVFRDRLKSYMLLGDTAMWHQPWTRLELLRLVRLLVKTAATTMNIALFIDGLDEFHGPPLELIELISTLKGPNTKICVSSRSWPVYEDAFAQQPSVRMEDLTDNDICEYVTSKLGQTAGFKALRGLDSDNADSLLRDIIQKAQGVFLWVFLVVRILNESLSDGQPLSELRNLVNSLPTELTALFGKILLSLQQDPTRFRRGSELIRILQAARSPPKLLQLSFAEEADIEFAFKLPVSPLAPTVEQARAELTRRRIGANLRCLVEVRRRRYVPLSRSPVEFIHRTVADYLKQEPLLGAPEDFNPSLQLCLAQIAWIKSLPADIKWGTKAEHYNGPSPYVGDSVIFDSLTSGMRYALQADPGYTGMQERLLKELERASAELTDCKTFARCMEVHTETTGDDPNSSIQWPCAHANCQEKAAFLYLATGEGLVSFVDSNLCNLARSCRKGYLLDLRRVARGEGDGRWLSEGNTSEAEPAGSPTSEREMSEEMEPSGLPTSEREMSAENRELAKLLTEHLADMQRDSAQQPGNHLLLPQRPHTGLSAQASTEGGGYRKTIQNFQRNVAKRLPTERIRTYLRSRGAEKTGSRRNTIEHRRS